MGNYKSELPITVFHHIAKTAGTTLRLVFKQFYEPDETLDIDSERDLDSACSVVANPAALRRIRLVYGHAASLFLGIYDGPVHIIAFVRDPFSRLVSHYRHSRILSYDPYHREALRMSLEEYAYATIQDDFLARQLLLPGAPDAFHVPSLVQRGRLYEQALRNIREKFTFVGIAERFEESIVLLSQHMAWPRLPVYTPLNVNEKGWPQEDIYARREEIERVYLPIDKLVYEQCVRRFEAQWNDDRAGNESLLASLRQVCSAVDELIGVRDDIQRHVNAETRPFAAIRANPRLQAVKSFLIPTRGNRPSGAPRTQ